MAVVTARLSPALRATPAKHFALGTVRALALNVTRRVLTSPFGTSAKESAARCGLLGGAFTPCKEAYEDDYALIAL